MLLVACFLICVATVPLAGGRLTALLATPLQRTWALSAALMVQIMIISVFPDADDGLRALAHLGSYGFVLLFLAANRSLPGLWLLGLGAGMNLAAIAANGGIMPTSGAAAETAGLVTHAGRFANSAVVADAHLSFLGDVFALPASLPLANVFSVGDVCIVAGAGLLLHQLSGSRLVGRRAEPAPALPEPEAVS